MPVYLWSTEADVEKTKAIGQRLRKALPDLVAVSSMEELFSAPPGKSSGLTHVLAIASSQDRRGLATLIDIASRYRDRLFVIVISDAISIDDYKAVMRTGGADWVSTDTDPQEILDIISRGNARAVTGDRKSVV